MSGEQGATATVKPSVTVIIPTYNNARFLSASLESVLNQTFRDLEVIVVDDGSTDDTQEVLTAYKERIRIIRKENAGPSSARNAGIKEAKGEFIAFQDADDLWLPEKLELQIAYLEEHPEIGVVFTDRATFDDQGLLESNSKEDYPSIPSGMIFEESYDLFS